MIFAPESTVRQVERLPVCCDHCTYCADLSDRSEALDTALVLSSHVYSLRAEWVLLQRLLSLVSAVPGWRERFSSSGLVRRAPELQEALQSDPSLQEFLRHSSFRPEPRFQFVEAALRYQEAQLPLALLHCPSCAPGFLYIEPSFFRRL